MKGFGLVVVAMGAFMTYIVFLVVGSFRTNVDLEYTDYYQKEIGFQQQIDAKQNTKNLKKQPLVYAANKVIYIEIPQNLVIQSGTVNIYRTVSAKDDFSVDFTDNYLEISLTDKESGGYRIEVSWQSEGKMFFYKEEIQL
ncbi:MAG: FixH family protein [Flavobacteriales bacterium]